jgi:hypothetical protein
MIFNFFKKNTNNTLSWEKEFRIALGADMNYQDEIKYNKINSLESIKSFINKEDQISKYFKSIAKHV